MNYLEIKAREWTCPEKDNLINYLEKNRHKYAVVDHLISDIVVISKESYLAGFKAADQWIDANDSLPDTLETMLIAIDGAVSPFFYLAWYDKNNKKWEDNNDGSIHQVTHWKRINDPIHL